MNWLRISKSYWKKRHTKILTFAITFYQYEIALLMLNQTIIIITHLFIIKFINIQLFDELPDSIL